MIYQLKDQLIYLKIDKLIETNMCNDNKMEKAIDKSFRASQIKIYIFIFLLFLY